MKKKEVKLSLLAHAILKRESPQESIFKTIRTNKQVHQSCMTQNHYKKIYCISIHLQLIQIEIKIITILVASEKILIYLEINITK